MVIGPQGHYDNSIRSKLAKKIREIRDKKDYSLDHRTIEQKAADHAREGKYGDLLDDAKQKWGEIAKEAAKEKAHKARDMFENVDTTLAAGYSTKMYLNNK